MPESKLGMTLVVFRDDHTWLRRDRSTVPPVWQGHDAPPAAGNVLHDACRQCLVQGRGREHGGRATLLGILGGNVRARDDMIYR